MSTKRGILIAKNRTVNVWGVANKKYKVPVGRATATTRGLPLIAVVSLQIEVLAAKS